MGKFVIRAVASGWKFDLKAGNGETVAVSEVYASAALCRKGAQSVSRCAAGARMVDLTLEQTGKNPAFELYRDRAGQYRFRLRARNGKVIAVSEGYCNKTACVNGIQSVRRNALDAQIKEE